MKAFAQLLDKLYFAYSHLQKKEILKSYFRDTRDPDRGYALAAITRAIAFKYFKRSLIKELILENTDSVLWSLSYDYVGDFSETAAHLWSVTDSSGHIALPGLSEIINFFQTANRVESKNYLKLLLDNAGVTERWAILKLGTGGLRIGVSSRFLKLALADYGHKNIHDIEQLWHTLEPPYTELFAWLEDRAEKPEARDKIFFHPVMLSHAVSDKELLNIQPDQFSAEWKYDGIRVQVVCTETDKKLFSRTGENISLAFPDILFNLKDPIVLDGELVIKQGNKIGSYNALQQRLNRKNPSKKLITDLPAHIILYDVLAVENKNIRHLTFKQRRKILEEWHSRQEYSEFSLSPLLIFNSHTDLINLRRQVTELPENCIEGLMLKRWESVYTAGRPAGQWYKWKRDALLIDAVMMYAQRGHGKRSSFYSDYTFGIWEDSEKIQEGEERSKILLPVGKAYFGFTDEELKKLDNWVRHHTIGRFGPVREVEKALVLEIAFDAVNPSPRHKAGYALRFPRINRIRWDKPAAEADTLSILKKWVNKE